MLNKTQINAINRLWKGKDFYNPSPEYLQYNYIPVFQHLDGHNIPFKAFTNGISLYAVYDEKKTNYRLNVAPKNILLMTV